MFELLKERLTKEEIIKIVCDYDFKFYKLEKENKQLKSQLQQEKNKIKEVREYIENNLYGDYGYECKQSKKELLEILEREKFVLDKVGDK